MQWCSWTGEIQKRIDPGSPADPQLSKLWTEPSDDLPWIYTIYLTENLNLYFGNYSIPIPNSIEICILFFVCNLIKQHIGLVHSQNKHKVPLLAHCLPIQNNLLKAATPEPYASKSTQHHKIKHKLVIFCANHLYITIRRANRQSRRQVNSVSDDVVRTFQSQMFRAMNQRQIQLSSGLTSMSTCICLVVFNQDCYISIVHLERNWYHQPGTKVP